MPIYMDRHDLPGVSAQDVAEAHQEDLKIQHLYNCRALTYWFDEERQTAFCLIEAPDKEAVTDLHKNAHGLVPHEIIEVDSQIVESFLGRIKDPELGQAANSYLEETAFRVILLIQIGCIGPNGPSFNERQTDPSAPTILEVIQETLLKYDGRLAQRGDKMLLCSFTSAQQAIRCAIELRSLLLERPNCSQFKFGLNAGNPIDDENAFFGQTINLAKHLSFISHHNTLVLSHVVLDYVRNESEAFDYRVPGMKALTQWEEEFVQQVFMKMEEMTTYSGYSVTDLAQEIGISKSQLYRNIVALTQITPNELIKEFKLYKALTLIDQHVKSISEIAYETGFGSPSYFSKCFKKHFSISPSSYIDLPSY